MESLKDTAVSFRPSSGNGELPQGGMSARGSRRTTAGSRPNSRRSTLGELGSVKGGRRGTQEAAAAVCSKQVAAALQALLTPTDAVAPPEGAALITSSPSLPNPCEEQPQAPAEVPLVVEPEEEAAPASPCPERPKDAVAAPSTCTAMIVYRPANTAVRAAPPKPAAVQQGSQADGGVVIKLIYQPYIDFVVGRSMHVTGTGTLTGQALARIAAERTKAKHTVELVPGKGPGPWAPLPLAKPRAAAQAPAPCAALVPHQGTAASTPPSAASFMYTSAAETMVSLCSRAVAEANSTAAHPYVFRDHASVPGRSIDTGAALAMLPREQAAAPPAASKRPAPCMALIVYRGDTAAVPSRAQHPQVQAGSSTLTIEHAGFAETMSSTRSLHAAAMPSCSSLHAAADDSTATVPYRPCHEVVVAAVLQAVVDATLLAAPPVGGVKPVADEPAAGSLKPAADKPAEFELVNNWNQNGEPRTMGLFRKMRVKLAKQSKALDWSVAGVPARLTQAGATPRPPRPHQCATVSAGVVSASTCKPAADEFRLVVNWNHRGQPASTGPFKGLLKHMLWLQKKKKSVYRSPSISVDWGAKGRLRWKLWAFKRARRARGGQGKPVDWGAPGRPNPARWPRKRALFRAPSIAADWSAAEVPACCLWEQKVAARGLGGGAADGVDWSGAGPPAVMACQQRRELAAVGFTLQGLLRRVSSTLLGQVVGACALLLACSFLQ